LISNEVIDLHGSILGLAEKIKREIFESTQCTCSIGVGTNRLIAKLATDSVKPDGIRIVTEPKEVLTPLMLRDLPGIGWRSEKKLEEERLVSVKDVWDLGERAEIELSRILGKENGRKIFNFCRGVDTRTIASSRKTVGAECNYGVRFDGEYGIDHALSGIAEEVQKRMVVLGVKGKRLTLKVKQRKPGAKPPPKFLGHGSCFNLSKSSDLIIPTRDAAKIAASAISLFHDFPNLALSDVRGIGITMSKLCDDIQKEEVAGSLEDWLKDTVANSKQEAVNEETELDGQGEGDWMEEDNDDLLDIPSASQIHMSQVEALPLKLQRQIISRLNKMKADETQAKDLSLVDATSQQRKMASSDSDSESEEEHHPPFVPLQKIDLYHDDLLPLKTFLDHNSTEDTNAISMVREFLDVVQTERPSAVIPMIRSITNRGDEWCSILPRFGWTSAKLALYKIKGPLPALFCSNK
jgi:hypothetical protein